MISELLAFRSGRLNKFEISFELFRSVGRLFDFPNCYAYQDAIEKYYLNKVLYTFIKSSFVAQRFDVEIKFLIIIDYLAVQMYLEAVRCLSTLPDESVHKLETVSENAFQNIIEWTWNYFESDQEHFDQR